MTEKRKAVRVSLLGGFRVSVGSRIITHDAWRLRKAAALVKILALAPGHRLHREQAMDLLWPTSARRAASNNLRQVLYGARRVLDPASDPRGSCLSLTDEQLILYPDGQLWIDVGAFEEAAAIARRSKDPATYAVATDLYAGDLLPEDRYEIWAEDRRRELRNEFLSLLVELASLHDERGEYVPAVEALKRAVAVEPTREDAHAALMRIYASSDREGEALVQYERLQRELSARLGIGPSTATRHLRDEIAGGTFSPERVRATSPPAQEPAAIGPHNLPAPRSSFIGRQRELIEVKQALGMTRLLTLIGAGGSGKTRLAVEAARGLAATYPDGIWLAELAPLSEEKLVPHVVAETLGVLEQPGRSLTDALIAHLRDKRLLLIVDSCEHLIDAVALLADALLDSCARLQVMATSREALDVEGEILWRVPSLSVPDADRPPTVGELGRHDAVRLFVDRAQRRSPGFGLTPQNATSVAQVCRRLEGIPLAIELAAARVGMLSVEQISGKLGDSLKLLTGGGRTAVPRQRTLRGTMDWSYELLLEEERKLFARVSTVAGGWSLEAAEAVGAGGPIEEGSVLDLLSNLVDKSLVSAEERESGTVRYRMLEPVKQYARERLEESGEAREILRRHAVFFLTLAQEAEPGLTGANQQTWVDHLEAEHDNLRAALSWSLEGEHQTAIRLAVALAHYWEIRSQFLEGSRWLEAALRRDGNAEAAARAKALSEAGTFAWHRGQYDQAIAFHGEALGLYRELGDEHGAAFALNCLGVQDLEQGDYRRAEPFFRAALASSRELKDKRTIGGALHNLAEVARFSGDFESARALGTEALAVYREMEDEWQIARMVGWLGMATFYNSDDRDAATEFLREGLELNREVGSWEYVAYCIEGLAGLAGAEGEGVRAARLFGAAETLREVIGAPLAPVDRTGYDRSVIASRRRLDEAAWNTAWSRGRTIPPEEAVEYALSEEQPAPQEPPAGEPVSSLTRREREVALLVSRGLTNRQISTELSISERTAANHVAKILRKLGLRSRAQIAARAGLITGAEDAGAKPYLT